MKELKENIAAFYGVEPEQVDILEELYRYKQNVWYRIALDGDEIPEAWVEAES